jgi:hypothetical protein
MASDKQLNVLKNMACDFVEIDDIGIKLSEAEKKWLIDNRLSKKKYINVKLSRWSAIYPEYRKFFKKILKKISNKKPQKNNINTKVRMSLNNGIRDHFKQNNKYVGNLSNDLLILLLGYSADDLVINLRHKYSGWMNDDNYGKWEIDHIIPKSKFKLNSLEEFRECWSINNLRPLSKEENRKKWNKTV